MVISKERGRTPPSSFLTAQSVGYQRQFPSICILRSTDNRVKSEKRYFRDYSNFSEEKFQGDLAEIDWEKIVTEREANVNKLFNFF